MLVSKYEALSPFFQNVMTCNTKPEEIEFKLRLIISFEYFVIKQVIVMIFKLLVPYRWNLGNYILYHASSVILFTRLLFVMLVHTAGWQTAVKIIPPTAPRKRGQYIVLTDVEKVNSLINFCKHQENVK